MPELVGIFDGGYATTRKNGFAKSVGLIIFRVSEREAAPVNVMLECDPNYKDSIIKYLKKLRPHKQEQKNESDS